MEGAVLQRFGWALDWAGAFHGGGHEWISMALVLCRFFAPGKMPPYISKSASVDLSEGPEDSRVSMCISFLNLSISSGTQLAHSMQQSLQQHNSTLCTIFG